MSVYKRPDSPFYHYDFQFKGDRFFGSTGETEKRAAEAFERAERDRARAAYQAQRGQPHRGLTFDQAAGRYWTEVGQHTSTADETEVNLERLVAWIGKDRPLAEVDDELLARLVARRRGEYRWGKKKHGLVSPSQVNRSVTQLLRRILTRARKVWKQALPAEPNWTAHLLEEPQERVRELAYEEEDRLEAVELPGYAEARLFAQITGVRRREVVTLTWPQVDFDAEVIRVVGKGNKPHVIPMTPELHELLWPLRGQHPTHVFTFVATRTRTCAKSGNRYERGKRYPISYWGFGTRLTRDLKKAGITGMRPVHDLRHTAATRLLRSTGNMKLVQRLLNHSTIRTTAKYAHASMDDLREAMRDTAADSTRRRTKSREKSRAAKRDKP